MHHGGGWFDCSASFGSDRPSAVQYRLSLHLISLSANAPDGGPSGGSALAGSEDAGAELERCASSSAMAARPGASAAPGTGDERARACSSACATPAEGIRVLGFRVFRRLLLRLRHTG